MIRTTLRQECWRGFERGGCERGYRLVDWQRENLERWRRANPDRLAPSFTITDPVIGATSDDAEPPAKRTRQRKPSLAAAIRQMKQAGLDIAGCEVNPREGTFKVIAGK